MTKKHKVYAAISAVWCAGVWYAFSAQAALPYTPLFTWTMPTLNVDGSALPAAQLREARFYCVKPPLVPVKTATPTKVVAMPVATWQTVAGTFSTGDWSCAVTAVDTTGGESALSNSLPFTIAPLVPQPPSVLIVQ